MKYAILCQTFDPITRLPIAPAEVFDSGITTIEDAHKQLDNAHRFAVAANPDKHVTKPSHWVTNVLQSKAEGDRTFKSYFIAEQAITR